VLAPRTGEATPIYAFAPVIPLVPGTAMFDTLIGLLGLTSRAGAATTVDQVAVDATTATLTIIALAVGAIGPTLVLGRRIARLMDRSPIESDG
jgi:uncharacterized membrane protein YjjB (DUF3815 family)